MTNVLKILAQSSSHIGHSCCSVNQNILIFFILYLRKLLTVNVFIGHSVGEGVMKYTLDNFNTNTHDNSHAADLIT